MTSVMTVQARSRATARFSRDHTRSITTWVGVVAAGALVAAVVETAPVAGVVSAVGGWAAATTAALTWTTAGALAVIMILQYVAAAVSTRAAAGVSLPFGELVATQVAATAANSLTPAGLGGVTVTGRYLARRGRMRPSGAAAAVSALAVFGGAADVFAFALLIGLGSLVGMAGADGEVPLLVRRLLGVVPHPSTMWLWIAGGIAAVACVVAIGARRRHGAAGRRLVEGLDAYRSNLAALVHRPGRMAVLMSTSAATTLLMATGFAAVATLGPAGLPIGLSGALMIGYMVAAAAGNAIPTPGGIGTADAAFTGVLVAARVPLATAVGTVLAFRLMTFWAPVVLGALLIKPLRSRGAL